MLRLWFALLLIASIAFANPIFDFAERVAGSKDFATTLSIDARVLQDAAEHSFNLIVDLVVRNQEDFYLEIKEPVELVGLKFWYYGRTKRFYFESLGYVGIENIDIPVGTFISLFELLFKMFQTPMTILSIAGNTVTVKPAPIFTSQAKEPVIFRMTFEDGFIKQIMIMSNNSDEFVKLTFENLKLGIDVDSFFKNR